MFLHQHLYSNGVIHPNTFIRGGTAKFAEVLQNISKSHNVEFRVNAKVKSIKLDNEFCKGVVLENGDKIESNIVVSGVDPKNTFINLVGSPNLNPNFRTQVRNIKDVNLKLSGKISTEWMSIAQCFAGKASSPPLPGTRKLITQ